MVNWIKQTDLIGREFQLVDLTVEEQFSVWDNGARKFIKGDVSITGKDGISRHLEKSEGKTTAIKFLKTADFTELFPGCRKVNQFNRLVIQGKETYKCGFSSTVHKQLSDAVNTLLTVNKDPRDILFTITGSKTNNIVKYDIIMRTADVMKLDIRELDGKTIEVTRDKWGENINITEEKMVTTKKAFDPNAIKRMVN